MGGSRGTSRWSAWIVTVTLLLAVHAAAQELPPGQALPVAVHHGRCEVVLPTTRPDEKYYLVIGSLARGAEEYHVQIHTDRSPGPVFLPFEKPLEDARWAQQIRDIHERLTQARRLQQPAVLYPPLRNPPRQKVFYLFIKEHDFQNPANYVTVHSDLQGLGRHCQVYVDRSCTDRLALQPTVDDVVRTFDEEIYPRASRALGRVEDVDRDGRFTILFTSWLGKLADGKVSLGGFVRGSDFYRDLPGPYGNHCDMMYLNTDLKPGPYLHTLLAHEYTHAVIFSEHVFGNYLPEVPRQDEESWLNEGLAHLVEEMNGYSWNNLDYRISAFLSDPAHCSLVVPDYYSAGLWRSHGHRGATYLFLHWCSARLGSTMPTELIQTNLAGIRNLEAAAREPFAELFRQWTVALVLDSNRLAASAAPGDLRAAPQRPMELHDAIGGRLLCGVRYDLLPLAGGCHKFQLAGTTSTAVLLHSPAGTFAHITIAAEPTADLQVSVIRLAPATARLSLRHEMVKGSRNSLRLILTAYDSAVTLDGSAWERLRPVANRPEDTSYRPQVAANALPPGWFDKAAVAAGETCVSRVIELPEEVAVGNPIIFKVAATDKAGHHLAAWDLLEAPGR